ncbi:DUF6191 domain-containing protein [Streptomyces decoyicus]|uniref:DUF6191 domain-containing protein n=1 Tax=Streptomyces decoyicus TaxID=249567 RepID=UPI0036339368
MLVTLSIPALPRQAPLDNTLKRSGKPAGRNSSPGYLHFSGRLPAAADIPSPRPARPRLPPNRTKSGAAASAAPSASRHASRSPCGRLGASGVTPRNGSPVRQRQLLYASPEGSNGQAKARTSVTGSRETGTRRRSQVLPIVAGVVAALWVLLALRDDTESGAPPRSSVDLQSGTAVIRPEPGHRPGPR